MFSFALLVIVFDVVLIFIIVDRVHLNFLAFPFVSLGFSRNVLELWSVSFLGTVLFCGYNRLLCDGLFDAFGSWTIFPFLLYMFTFPRSGFL